jgi:hypothetical protein
MGVRMDVVVMAGGIGRRGGRVTGSWGAVVVVRHVVLQQGTPGGTPGSGFGRLHGRGRAVMVFAVSDDRRTAKRIAAA